MNEFLQTLAISVVPSLVAGVLSYLASAKNSKVQIDSIKEQNKADIEKLIEQHKIDIEALKEKHKMDIEIKEKEHKHQLEMVKLQHENELKKEEEGMKNQLAANAIGGIFGTLFSQSSPLTEGINKAMVDALEKSLTEDEK